jgi:hypothetical protein
MQGRPNAQQQSRITLLQELPKDRTSATTTYVAWREEHLWNVSVLREARFATLHYHRHARFKMRP